jgi:hypothetical protein
VNYCTGVFVSSLLVAVPCLAQWPVGAINGSVIGDDGYIPRQGIVSYQRMHRSVGPASAPRPAVGEAVVRGTSAFVNGTFSIAGLPAGEYVLCAEVPGEPYLNPCKWSSSVKLTLASGTVQRPALVLKKGVFLKTRINDPKSLLPPIKNDPSRAANLIVGVEFGNGAFLAAELQKGDQTGRDYQLAVPTGVPLKLWVFSRHVTLTDSNGAAVDNSGGRIGLQTADGQDLSFTLNVTGQDPRASR